MENGNNLTKLTIAPLNFQLMPKDFLTAVSCAIKVAKTIWKYPITRSALIPTNCHICGTF
jgi:hypothetical protein